MKLKTGKTIEKINDTNLGSSKKIKTNKLLSRQTKENGKKTQMTNIWNE